MDLVEKQENALDRHPWEIARFQIILKLFAQYANGVKADFTVLDIGCGDTYIAEEFLKIYPAVNYYAVDTAFNEGMICEYNSYFKSKNVNISLYKDVKEIEASKVVKADFVFLFDVIEHIEDEVSFLKCINERELLKKEVKYFITVPAFLGLYTSHDVFLQHYRRYNKKELEKKIFLSGLEGIAQGFFFFSLLLPRIIQKLKEGNREVKSGVGIGQWKSKGKLDKIIVKILLVDYFIVNVLTKLGIRLPGLSNYIVCKKLQ